MDGAELRDAVSRTHSPLGELGPVERLLDSADTFRMTLDHLPCDTDRQALGADTDALRPGAHRERILSAVQLASEAARR
ncbi:MAG: hypothetical protein ABR543_05840 [Gemmatimonadaceae bacterium]